MLWAEREGPSSCGETHSNVRSTLDDEAVCEAVQSYGAALLVQIDLLLGQKVSDPAAGAEPYGGAETRHSRISSTDTISHGLHYVVIPMIIRIMHAYFLYWVHKLNAVQKE